MEIQQMMESLLAKMDTTLKEIKAGQDAWIAEMWAWPTKKRRRPVWRLWSQPHWRVIASGSL
jgi:hypothetical protein